MSAGVLVFDPALPREARPRVMTPAEGVATTTQSVSRHTAVDIGFNHLGRRLKRLAPFQFASVPVLVDLYFDDRGRQ